MAQVVGRILCACVAGALEMTTIQKNRMAQVQMTVQMAGLMGMMMVKCSSEFN